MKKLHVTPAAAAASEHLQKIKAAAEQAMLDKAMEVDIRQLVLHASGQETMTFLQPADVFDECIVGASELGGGESVVVYNKMAVLAALSGHLGITFEEAFDQLTAQLAAQRYEASVADAAGNKLPSPPVFVVDVRDLV